MSSTVKAWLQAARPLAQTNIAVPLVIGEVLAFRTTGEIHLALVVLTHLAGVFHQLFIVFANDVADFAGDRLNTTFTPFSGGSRVLVEGRLGRDQLARAAWLMLGLLAAVSITAAVLFGRWQVPLCWAVGVALLWAYSFDPLRLSYRGLGEITQGLGVGVILPLAGYVSQTGTLVGLPLVVLPVMFLLGFTSNIVTALPDEPADRRCDKQTIPVRWGGDRARRLVLALHGIAIASTPLVTPNAPELAWLVVEVLALGLLAPALVLRRHATPQHRAASVRFVFFNGAVANALMLGWATTWLITST